MPDDGDTTIRELRDRAREFTDERDWEQFHNPKDLAMAICVEAAELMEPFLWKNPATDEVRSDDGLMGKVEEELADVLILAMCMANTLDIDVAGACRRKMERNAARYPADRARGKADKYTKYE
jgi:dCTP diphosphatase